MKIHLVIGNRTVCSQSLPRAGLLTVNPKLATCRNCMRTHLFRQAKPRKTVRTKNQMIQQEFFK